MSAIRGSRKGAFSEEIESYPLLRPRGAEVTTVLKEIAKKTRRELDNRVQIRMNADDSERRATDALNDPAAELGEQAVAILTGMEVLAHVPVLKLGVAALRIADSIRGQALLKKIDAFVRGLDLVTREQRAEMVSRLHQDREYSETVGEYLIEYLDRINGQSRLPHLQRLRDAKLTGQCFIA
jgi:hypothetical protein